MSVFVQDEATSQKASYSEKNIVDLWKPVVTDKEEAELSQRMTDDCTQALAIQAATRDAQPKLAMKKLGRPFGTGKLQLVNSSGILYVFKATVISYEQHLLLLWLSGLS